MTRHVDTFQGKSTMAEPTNKTILLLDIEGSGGRLHVEQAVIRRMLYAVLRETMTAAGVEPTEYRAEDRGDGAFVLIDPSVPKPQLIRALLTTTPMRLYSNNRLAAKGAQVRLRLVLHTGEVALDEYGAVGADIVSAFRLLDSGELHHALKRTSEPSVLCVSDAIYWGVVHHAHHGIRPEHFHPFEGEGKEGPLSGWYHDATRLAGDALSSPSAPAGRAVDTDDGRRAPTREDEHAGGASAAAPRIDTRSGTFFFGAARVEGDAVGGDKYVGFEPGRAVKGGRRTSDGEESR